MMTLHHTATWVDADPYAALMAAEAVLEDDDALIAALTRGDDALVDMILTAVDDDED